MIKRHKNTDSVLAISLLAILSFSVIPFINAQTGGQSPPRPSVSITDPVYCVSTIRPGTLLVTGTSASSIGITKVELSVHSFPFQSVYRFEMTTPASEGDWSTWSLPVTLAENGMHRVLARVTDLNGVENWAEVIFNVDESMGPPTISPSNQTSQATASGNPRPDITKKRIAIVDPTFTDAAYGSDGFYDFYFKYHNTDKSAVISTDLSFMTSEIPRPEFIDRNYYIPLIDHLRDDTTIELSIIRDQDVHAGMLWGSDGIPDYDALILLHSEYVTVQEYEYLRKYVADGGVIVFLDANIFYAEVTYDEKACTVTLVKGHDWEFDGSSVRRSVAERFFDENKEWMGSNFIVRDIRDPVEFGKNPFEYVHFEENYLNNPKAKVLLDYDAEIIDSEPRNVPTFLLHGVLRDYFGIEGAGYLDTTNQDNRGKRVATYELDHGKGRGIMLGLYGQNLLTNSAFMDYFDNVLLTRAIGTAHQIAPLAEMPDVNSNSINPLTVYWRMNSGKVVEIQVDKENKKLEILLESSNVVGSNIVPNELKIVLPKELIDITGDSHFAVFVDGAATSFNSIEDDVERSIVIPMSSTADKVEIYGTSIIPEFSEFSMLVVLVTAMMIGASLWTGRLRFSTRPP